MRRLGQFTIPIAIHLRWEWDATRSESSTKGKVMRNLGKRSRAIQQQGQEVGACRSTSFLTLMCSLISAKGARVGSPKRLLLLLFSVLLSSIASVVLVSPPTVSAAPLDTGTGAVETAAERQLAELARESDVIVLGRIVSTRVEPRGPGGAPGIHTAVTISNPESIKGDTGSSVEFWVQGGKLGGRLRRVVGQATFTPGQEALVFLKSSESNALLPTRMGLGKWTLEAREGATWVVSGSEHLDRVTLSIARDAVLKGATP